jgi:hypothetical protein
MTSVLRPRAIGTAFLAVAAAMDGLYGKAAGRKPADPERIAELKKQQADEDDAIKACGHLESEHCECHWLLAQNGMRWR